MVVVVLLLTAAVLVVGARVVLVVVVVISHGASAGALQVSLGLQHAKYSALGSLSFGVTGFPSRSSLTEQCDLIDGHTEFRHPLRQIFRARRSPLQFDLHLS